MYFLAFIDDSSKFTVIYLLTHKDEVFDKINDYAEIIHTQFGKYPTAIGSDNGGEYIGKTQKSF